MTRTPLALLLAAALAGGASGQQQDTTRTRPARAARAARPARVDSTSPRATARDLVGADDPRCDELCARERMMDSLYGKDRERRPAATAAAPRTKPAPGPSPKRP